MLVSGVPIDEPPVSLQLAPAQDAPVFANLFEFYAYDLSDAFGLDIGADGTFGDYPKLPLYWQEPDRRFPYLIRSGEQLAGFALITRGSPFTNAADFDVAEFFVLKRYRHCGVGGRAAIWLWNQLPGRWSVRVAECNRTAQPFWSGVIAHYAQGQFVQEEHEVAGKRWQVFGFDSQARRA